MNEEYDLKEVVVTWICYSVVLVCSLLISVGLHIIAGIEKEVISMLSIFIVAKALTLMYRIIFENQELTAENILLIDGEISLDLVKFLLIFFIFFNVLKIPITILNFIVIVCLFTIILIFI